MFPNLFIAGRIYTGKSAVTRHFTESYGYYPIYSGNYLLEKLRVLTGNDGPFPNEAVVEMRERLTRLYGPLYILQDVPVEKPIIIDGIRSVEIAKALSGVGFIAVHIGASFEERLRNAADVRENHPSKEVVASVEAISDRDMVHAADLEIISNSAGFSFINTRSRSIEALTAHILETVSAPSGVTH